MISKVITLFRSLAALASQFEDMSSDIVRSLLLVWLALHRSHCQQCLTPSTIELTSQDLLCNQPYFFTILPKTAETVLLDNVCNTFFPLPDDPNTIVFYSSSVYCDGSNSVVSSIVTSTGKGRFRAANPMGTDSYYIVGYAGCDTLIGYICPEYGKTTPPIIFGTSTNCSPVGLSCLRKVEEVISNAGLPEQDMYVLPMKLPNRCVTQTACTLPPNPFYNKLGPSVGLVY